MTVLYLRGGQSSLAIDLSGEVPVVIHWGRDLGENPVIPSALGNAVAHSLYDTPVLVELLPQASTGWRGRPAVSGHRAGGTDFSPSFTTTAFTQDAGEDTITLAAAEQLSIPAVISLSPAGMLRIRHELTNTSDEPYALEAMNVILPVGPAASEVLDLTGRWIREQHPQRQSLRQGTWLREYRHNRTGHDSSALTMVGAPGFANRHGEVWATHFGHSGNRVTFVEKPPSGPAMVGSGEL